MSGFQKSYFFSGSSPNLCSDTFKCAFGGVRLNDHFSIFHSMLFVSFDPRIIGVTTTKERNFHFICVMYNNRRTQLEPCKKARKDS